MHSLATGLPQPNCRVPWKNTTKTRNCVRPLAARCCKPAADNPAGKCAGLRRYVSQNHGLEWRVGVWGPKNDHFERCLVSLLFLHCILRQFGVRCQTGCGLAWWRLRRAPLPKALSGFWHHHPAAAQAASLRLFVILKQRLRKESIGAIPSSTP